MTDAWPHRESIPVRYVEVDQQQVVYNAHYLTYCDLALTGWMRAALGDAEAVDWMVVKATVEWTGSATFGDVLDVDCGIARWGTTSFTAGFRGTVDGRPIFTAEVTSVCVADGRATPIGDEVRTALGPVPPG